MPIPGNQIPADAAADGRRGASHADREQVIEVLKAAFVQGRLTKDELGTRVGQAFTSQTYAELTKVIADLPAELMEAAPRQIARTRPRVSMSTAISAFAFAMLAALMGMLAAIVTRSMIGLISATVSIGVVGVLAFGATMAASWHGRAR
jgi:Domain of unknown function (DUF1707)